MREALALSLRQCRDLSIARGLHSQVLNENADLFLGNLVVQMYGNCGSFDDAWLAFLELDQKNVFSWNIVLAACNQNGRLKEAESVFERMPHQGIVSCNSILSAFVQLGLLRDAEHLFESMPKVDVISYNAMLQGYATSGYFERARSMFDAMPKRDVISWNSMLRASAQHGHSVQAMDWFIKMPQVDQLSWNAVITGFAQNGHLVEAVKLLENTRQMLTEVPSHCTNSVMSAFGNRGWLQDARDLFERSTQRDVVTWNLLVQAYAQSGHVGDAENVLGRMPHFSVVACNCLLQQAEPINLRTLFDSMEHRNLISWTTMVQVHSQMGDAEAAKQAFDLMPHRSVVPWNLLLQAYSRNGYTEDVVSMFREMPERDIISWTSLITVFKDIDASKSAFNRMAQHDSHSRNIMLLALVDANRLSSAKIMLADCSGEVSAGNVMISAYTERGLLGEAEHVFREINEPDAITWNSMITAYAENGHLQRAKLMFDGMPQRNVVSWNALLAAQKETSAQLEADAIFQRIPQWNTFSWNAMVQAHVKRGNAAAAKHVFEITPQRNAASWNALVAFSQEGQSHVSKLAFEKMPSRDDMSWNCMLSGYASNRCVKDAKNLFDELPRRNIIAWNTMLSAFSQNGHCTESLKLFCSMDLEGVKPREIAYACTICACASSSALKLGKLIHAEALQDGCDGDVVVGTSLVNFYSECGQLDTARCLFDKMVTKNVATWNALLTAYARNGRSSSERLFELLGLMQLDGMSPNDITVVSLLSTYSHAGLINDGLRCFVTLVRDHGFEPSMEHYKGLVDLLGRAGRVEEAEELVKCMPFQPDALAWSTVLSACKSYGDSERGLHAGERVLELDQNEGTTYVLLSSSARSH